jgi:hypothetical protein
VNPLKYIHDANEGSDEKVQDSDTCVITLWIISKTHKECRKEVENYPEIEQAHDYMDPCAHLSQPLITVEQAVLTHVNHNNQ